MASTTERGLGWSHQKRRAALLRNHVDGTLCEHCLKPMYVSQPLHADHSIARAEGGTEADRLLHAWCNESRGDGSRDQPDMRFTMTSQDW
jgi:hypothetical protein